MPHRGWRRQYARHRRREDGGTRGGATVSTARGRRVTSADVAREAGVSRATGNHVRGVVAALAGRPIPPAPVGHGYRLEVRGSA